MVPKFATKADRKLVIRVLSAVKSRPLFTKYLRLCTTSHRVRTIIQLCSRRVIIAINPSFTCLHFDFSMLARSFLSSFYTLYAKSISVTSGWRNNRRHNDKMTQHSSFQTDYRLACSLIRVLHVVFNLFDTYRTMHHLSLGLWRSLGTVTAVCRSGIER